MHECMFTVHSVVCCFQNWYTGQMKQIFDWLNERQDASLHPYQLTCLISIMKVAHRQQCSPLL